MVDLSPSTPSLAAKKVLNAALESWLDLNDDEDGIAAPIAAALRAAAEQCQIEWNYHPDYPETEWVVVASDLTAIAAELENHAN